jgi:uncharacterized protein
MRHPRNEMIPNTTSFSFFDALYGRCNFSKPLSDLARQPLVQRLREIRLSNIDSLSTPGIANVSRFEHSLGTAHLASYVRFSKSITAEDRLILEAACLLHDTAMQPFGHLVEEALRYLGVNVPHEERWQRIASGGDLSHIGGIDFQIYLGLEAGLIGWVNDNFANPTSRPLQRILEAISGEGRLGKAVRGAVDVDNLDNVARAAYHMGLTVDRSLPVRVAANMVIDDQGIVFAEEGVEALREWLDLRALVYERFMLSREDFAGKVMLIFATTKAVEKGCLEKNDWVLTDRTYLQRLLECPDEAVSETTKRWLTMDLWPLSDLIWMNGETPPYQQIYEFSKRVSELLRRECLAYRIKDKKTRDLRIRVASGEIVNLGTASSHWLLGLGSPIRAPFTRAENKQISALAERFFHADCEGGAEYHSTETTALELFQTA